MKRIIAIDPGTTESAYIVWDGTFILDHGKVLNDDIRRLIKSYPELSTKVYIEMIASYGMPVGKETFETCLWIGRFLECCVNQQLHSELIYRKDVKMWHCNSMRAKDSNIRAALIDKYGVPGVKKAPGITYKLSGDEWQAFAICTYVTEKQNERT